MYVSRNSLAR